MEKSMIMTKQVKRVFLILGILLLVSLTANRALAADRKYGDYTYQASNGKVTIVKYKGKDKEIKIPSKIKGIKVTEIGNKAFSNNKALIKVKIPSGINKIGLSAFEYCSELKTIELPNTLTSLGDYTFVGCGKLRKIVLPNSLKSLPVSAFESCGSLSSVTLPSKIKEIPDTFFYRCGLTSIKIPDSVTSIKSWAFLGCTKLTEINMPKNLKFLGDSAFAECSSLIKYSIPKGVTSIEGGTFKGCINLKEITIPDTVTKIGMRAFEKCSSLTHIKLPESIQTIDSFAFNECTSLKTINIPKNITEIPYNGFFDCYNLEAIKLSDKVTKIGSGAFYNCRKLDTNIPTGLESIENQAFYNCESLPEIIIPKGIISVPNYAFYGCKSAKVLQIPDTVTSLDLNAFNYCSSIREVTIPDGISTIPYFIGCSLLEKININDNNTNYKVVDGVIYNKDKSVLLRYTPACKNDGFTIPDSVTAVGDYAFSGLSTIRELTIPDTVKSIGKGLFYGSTSIENVTFPSHITELPELTFCDTNLKKAIIPKNITKVGYQAYADCKQLTSITLHNAVTDIGDEGAGEATAAIPGCINLKEFIVAADNPYYEAIDGVLYHKIKDGKIRLVCYPSQKPDTSFHIPEGTTDMCIYAFYQCDNLQTLYLPDSMTGLYNYFINCTDLKIMVPATVTHFMSDEHSTDWPIFNQCENCYLYVKSGSEAYKYCTRNSEIPYKLWK